MNHTTRLQAAAAILATTGKSIRGHAYGTMQGWNRVAVTTACLAAGFDLYTAILPSTRAAVVATVVGNR